MPVVILRFATNSPYPVNYSLFAKITKYLYGAVEINQCPADGKQKSCHYWIFPYPNQGIELPVIVHGRTKRVLSKPCLRTGWKGTEPRISAIIHNILNYFIRNARWSSWQENSNLHCKVHRFRVASLQYLISFPIDNEDYIRQCASRFGSKCCRLS